VIRRHVKIKAQLPGKPDCNHRERAVDCNQAPAVEYPTRQSLNCAPRMTAQLPQQTSRHVERHIVARSPAFQFDEWHKRILFRVDGYDVGWILCYDSLLRKRPRIEVVAQFEIISISSLGSSRALCRGGDRAR